MSCAALSTLIAERKTHFAKLRTFSTKVNIELDKNMTSRTFSAIECCFFFWRRMKQIVFCFMYFFFLWSQSHLSKFSDRIHRTDRIFVTTVRQILLGKYWFNYTSPISHYTKKILKFENLVIRQIRSKSIWRRMGRSNLDGLKPAQCAHGKQQTNI